MRQPRSIRFHLTGVFLVFFLLVVVLGLFSIWRLSDFNRLSADVAELWLPTTRVLGDLNNFTSDFRAIEGSNLLSSDAPEIAATEAEMAGLDRSIADAERGFERIRRHAAEDDLYGRFKERWTDYRGIVNQILVLSRTGRKAEALTIYAGASRKAYDAASDTLGQLTDQAVADAQLASDRLGVAYWQAFWLILLAMAVAGVMVVAALVHIRRSISAPLLHLADRMRRLAANDTDIDIRETERRDEIGEMAQAAVVFRKNAIELMRSQRMLARQTAMLKERLAQEQRLASLQRNFVSMASHEFRTPLAIIDGHTQRLISMRNRLTAEELAQRVRKVRSMVRRMTQLIDHLIGSARLIDGPIELYYHPGQVDLGSLLRDSCRLQRELTPDAQISEPAEAGPRLIVYGDGSLLSQLFSNLLSNAVKYSPEGGLIEAIAVHAGAAVVVSIKDHGIGIPEVDRGRVFERYYRGNNTSGIGGSGVGLSLVKSIVELHRGAISLQSTEGEGSRFTLRLPAASPELRTARPSGAIPADEPN
jgi:two-component system, OmpR family, sensor kinase